MNAQSLGGYGLLFSLFLSVAYGFSLLPAIWPAAILAWLAGVLLCLTLPPRATKVVVLLFAAGCGVWALAWHQGAGFDWRRALGINQGLIALLTGVHFLRLVALPPADSTERLPRGQSAFLRTWLGLHGLGAIINLSIVFLVGDRLQRHQALTPLSLMLLTRAFSTAAFWSPFFAAFAAALAYAPDASVGTIMLVGMPLAVLGFGLSIFEFRRQSDVDLSQFQGYPLHLDALLVPLLLVAFVLSGRMALPEVPIILLIACGAWLITMGLLLKRCGGPAAMGAMHAYVQTKLPQMSAELLLFLAAGWFGSGLTAWFGVLPVTGVLQTFSGTSASILLCGMVGLAVCGVHPVISIAMVGAWVAPMDVSHTLLAIMFLMSWAIGVCVSPFSGMNLALQGRYEVTGWQLFRWNKAYALKMLIVSALVLLALDAWVL